MTNKSRTWPAYLETYESGALKEKKEKAAELLSSCRMCPRNCGVNRLEDNRSGPLRPLERQPLGQPQRQSAGTQKPQRGEGSPRTQERQRREGRREGPAKPGKLGFCKTGRNAGVASFFAHFGEEDVLKGWRGSGTIFFSRCNLKCVFCQNWETSRGAEGRNREAGEIAAIMMRLQEEGCHNINFVTPSHVVPQVLEAIYFAVRKGLQIPVVYNTGGYDSLDALRLLDGVVDIYMPDFKIWDPELCERYFKAGDYSERAREALKEMHRQVGILEMDPETGIARRGILLRHLVMPGLVEDSRRILHWVADEVSKDTYINIMDQYHPAGDVLYSKDYPELASHRLLGEYGRVVKLAREEGLWRFDRRRMR